MAAWFGGRFPSPTEPQVRAWDAVKSGRNVLVAAPTGSGKTLAAFLAAIDDLVRDGLEGTLEDTTRVLYISPLKALANDVRKNLEEPLAGIRAELVALGLKPPELRTAVRSGDTPARERAASIRRPPHVFVTTPESLYILLTSEGGRRMLAGVRTLIIDEVHALVASKRGSHLALSVERLQELVGSPLVRIGLSATQRPIEEVARFLVGSPSVAPDGTPDCVIVDAGHSRRMDLRVEIPSSPLSAVMSQEVREEVHDRVAALVREHRTTLVFVNTRRQCERVARALSERLGEDVVTSHHGSLSREQRLGAEERLKAGSLKALVATASLELGIDIGDVDLAIQLGSTRSIATLLQRMGRSGHAVVGVPKGRIFPATRDELVEAAALLHCVRRGDLDTLSVPPRPLDILAQQIVAEVAAGERGEEELLALVRRAWPYRDLARADFDAVLAMLAEGYTTRRGRRGAWLHHDAVNRRIRARKGARLSAITSGGAIPDAADFDVVLEPAGVRIGSLNEDFAIESIAGDIFQLGNASWRILRVESGRVRVEDAKGQPPTMPFWLGEAPGRTHELSSGVCRIREEVQARLGQPGDAAAWLVEEVGLGPDGAEQLEAYLGAAHASLGVLPTHDTLVLERFFDEAGSMHVVLHAPFGSRINRAWGLALRKRFCGKFNFELQAAATEDAVILSLGPTHSFALEDVFGYLRSDGVEDVLTQAMLDAPVFTTRWRWNVTRSLAVLRQRGGKRVPPALQRMQSDDLLSLVFPDQVACFENLSGPRRIPDHPLVRQTIHDCHQEAMDLEGLKAVLASMEAGGKRLVARDLAEPSQLAAEVLNSQPYSFLDDAPLEERRTQAVQQRRWLDAQTASDLGALDPAAIDRVREEAWPEATTADELHDALVVTGHVTAAEGEGRGWSQLMDDLVGLRRATRVQHRDRVLWAAAERMPQILAVLPGARARPAITVPARHAARSWTPEEALVELVRGRLEALGPVTAARLSGELGVDELAVDGALLALETEGFALRGRYTVAAAGAGVVEWCDRRRLARIHRLTLNKLRAEIEPVATTVLIRFLLAWQHVEPDSRLAGTEGLLAVIEQMSGFEAPASAWESDILPARLDRFEPAALDALCLSGRVAWARLTPPRLTAAKGGRPREGASPVRATPIALGTREALATWTRSSEPGEEPALSSPGRAVLAHLRSRGASFVQEMAVGAGLLVTEVEAALGELVWCGLVTCDGFGGLRSLLAPSSDRKPTWRPRRLAPISALEAAGRWTPLARTEATDAGATLDPAALERIANGLLRRYGVVFKRLLAREDLLPPWRDLLRVLHRMEARGEIRGGRFVAGPPGEQFALPEAVQLLRSIRRQGTSGRLVSVSAADPLNVVGVVTPGRRIPAIASHRVLFRDGEPVAVREGRSVTWLTELDEPSRWQAQAALERRSPARPDVSRLARLHP